MSIPIMTPLQHLPELPQRTDWRIGCIGSGFIMRDCHLVAYRNAGWKPIAITSRNVEAAESVAQQHQIPKVHHSISDILHDPEIEVLDIAVPPDEQPEIIRQAIVAGRGRLQGILAQKPLAMSVTVARDLVNRAAEAGIALAVNQNMRYDQSVRAMKDLLNRGWLGTPIFASLDMRAVPHWMPWAQSLPSLSTFVMSIHHLDTFRYWFGTPDRVLASTRPDPRTAFPHSDGINLYILEWDNGMRASSWDDVWAGPCHEGITGDNHIHWRIEGTDGLAKGTIGWPSYPNRTPSTIAFSTRQQPGTWIQPSWDEVWFPDAFVGTMAQLLCALEQNQEPEISGRDNLETLALCEGVFAAAKEHRVTTVQEFLR